MRLTIPTLILSSAIVFLAGACRYRGYQWADQLCELVSQACNWHSWFGVAGGATAALWLIVRSHTESDLALWRAKPWRERI